MFLLLMYFSISPKGWYYGTPPPFSLAPPSFNFKLYGEKHCLITLMEHGASIMYHRCTPPPLIYILGATWYMYVSNIVFDQHNYYIIS